jgi:TetR/AcrR family fatty acid metabolism transcriptional regulator
MLFYVNPHDKKQKIMYAASRIFAQKGYYQAKMEEIAREAEVGKGTVYEYFASKQDLFLDLLSTGMKYYREALAEGVNPTLSCTEKLRQAAFFHLDFIQKHKDISRVFMQECPQINKEMTNIIIKARQGEIDFLSSIFEKGIKTGAIQNVDSRFVAQLFWGAVHAVGVSMVWTDEKLDLEQMAHQVVDVFIRGLGKQ